MLGVPRVIFSSSGAFEFSVSSKIWQDIPKGNNNPSDENSLISFPKIPNSPNYPWWQVREIYEMYKEGDPNWECFRNSMLANLDEWGILINSFSALEGVYLDHLKRELGHDKVWAVGPLLPTKDDLVGPVQRGGAHSCQEVMMWLDKRMNGSVVYVCYGSRVDPTRKQMNELATALECNGVQFIFCICDGQVGGDYGVVPNGFEDRVAGKGLSAGVVMLTWPINGDQFTNANLLVDQLGVSIRVGVGGGSDNVPNSAELGRLLAKSVGENETLPEKDRAMRLRDATLSAVTGNSKRDLDEFVKRLHNRLNDFNSLEHSHAREVGGNYGVVPNGFEDRVAGRGLVIKQWVPQVAILRHQAVGAFLTHCGWNSVLEGLSAGVVMLTWPISGDQFTNANLLVDQLGVSIRVSVSGGSDNVPNSAKLGRLLAKSVDENETLPEKDRAMRLRDAALSAVTGNFKRDLDEFVKRLHNRLNDFNISIAWNTFPCKRSR
uniref:Glycosyltransferase n=1 Tax=Fagus sylvatica TaxID=28930 RepID=A0A2N9G6K7_FAGSY